MSSPFWNSRESRYFELRAPAKRVVTLPPLPPDIMPATMKMHSSFSSSPRPLGAGSEMGRQSQIYQRNESGNAMKGIFGQDHLAWGNEQQQGVPRAVTMHTPAPSQVEYPLPGSEGSCDACGEVVTRFYHCADCKEETGLFDLCTPCCAAIYMNKGTSSAVAKSGGPPPHPTHNYNTHRMIHVAPPGQ